MRYTQTTTRIFLFYFSALVLFSSCSKPPEAPELSRRSPDPVEKIVFPQGIGPAEIRRLFTALNRDGRLDRLKPFFLDPSDATLSRVGNVVTRFLYERALETEGFPAVLGQHVSAKSFSALNGWIQGSGAVMVPLLATGIADRRLKDLVAFDYGFLSPKFTTLLPTPTWRTPLEDAEAIAWAKDGRLLLANAELKAAARGTFLAFYKETGGPTLARQALEYVSALSQKRATDFSESIARLTAHAERPLAGIAPLFELLSKHPAGLLPFAIDKMESEADLRGELSSLLFHHAYDSIGSALLRNLKTAELATKESRFIVARRSIEEIAGRSRPAESPDYLLGNLPIYLPTVVTAMWLEKLAESPENKVIVDRLKAPKTAAVDLNVTILAPNLSLPIFTKTADGTGNEVNPVLAKELETLGLKEFLDPLKTIANVPLLGNFHYDIAFPNPRLLFPEAIEQVLRQCEQVRPFGDPALLARVFFEKLTASSDVKRKFAELDKTDWLQWLHARAIDPEIWPAVKALLFSRQGLLSDNGDTKKLLLSLFEEKPEYYEYLEKLFTQLRSLDTLDSAPAGKASLFSFYVEFNESLSKQDRLGLLRAAESASRFLGLSRTKLAGPLKELGFLLAQPKRLNEALTWVGETARTNGDELLRPFTAWQSAPAAVFDGHWDLAASVVSATDELALARALQSGLSLLPEARTLTDAEYAWLSRFVAEGGWSQSFDFIFETTSRRTLSEFMEVVQQLDESGYLGEVFETALRLKDERARALAAALLQLQKSGELRQGLRFLQVIVK